MRPLLYKHLIQIFEQLSVISLHDVCRSDFSFFLFCQVKLKIILLYNPTAFQQFLLWLIKLLEFEQFGFSVLYGMICESKQFLQSEPLLHAGTVSNVRVK